MILPSLLVSPFLPFAKCFFIAGGVDLGVYLTRPPCPAPRRRPCPCACSETSSLICLYKGMGCLAYDLSRGSGTVLLSQSGRVSRRRGLSAVPSCSHRMEQVPQASGGEALHGRPEAPEYAGIPSHYSYTGRGAKPDGLVDDRTRSPSTDFAFLSASKLACSFPRGVAWVSPIVRAF
jgi:hypothetical protein